MSDFETEFARRNALTQALAMAPCLLHDNFLEMRDTAEASLIRHLPSLKLEDRAWVNAEEIHALAEALDNEDPALRLALLAALSKVGDRRVLRRVEALWRDIQDSETEAADRLRAATYNCMASLREHIALTNQSQTLLRGSAAPTAGPNSTMLRPTQSAVSSAPTELLRPTFECVCPEADEPTLKNV
jgi:hypothetical protein